ncbi:hypothetical protein MHK_003687, partial [Candidatus Magnetomorum sp. HK-1]
ECGPVILIANLCSALTGLIILFLFTQGDALGCYVMPFQGKKLTKKKNTPKSNVRLFGNAPTSNFNVLEVNIIEK